LAGLDPAIHVFSGEIAAKTWMAGSSPAKGIFCRVILGNGEKKIAIQPKRNLH